MARRLIRKLLLPLLTFALIVVIAAPAALGGLLKFQLQRLVDEPGLVGPGFGIKRIEHEFSWFSSGLHYQVWETDVDTGERYYDVVIQGAIDHGPLLFADLSLGLARLQGQLNYQPETLKQPIKTTIDLHVSLTALAKAKLTAQTQALATRSNANLAFEGFMAQLRYALSGKRFEIKASLKQLQLDSYPLATSALELLIDLHRKDHSPWFGHVQLNLAPLSVGNESFASSQIDLDIGHHEQRMNIDAHINLANEDAFYGPTDIKLGIHNLDPPALQQILNIHSEIQQHPYPEQAQQTLLPQLVAELANLIQHGAKTFIAPFELQTQRGDVKGNFYFNTQAAQGMGLAGLLLGSGESALSIPFTVANHWQTQSVFNPVWHALQNTGLLTPQFGQYYWLDARYADSKLTVNGKSYPLPFLP